MGLSCLCEVGAYLYLYHALWLRLDNEEKCEHCETKINLSGGITVHGFDYECKVHNSIWLEINYLYRGIEG